MTYQDVNRLMESLSTLLGVPYAYYQFETETSPPFLVFEYQDSEDFYADGINYQRIEPLAIHFCSDEKDFASEITIETFLNANDLTFTKQPLYIDSDKMWQTTYYTEVLIHG